MKKMLDAFASFFIGEDLENDTAENDVIAETAQEDQIEERKKREFRKPKFTSAIKEKEREKEPERERSSRFTDSSSHTSYSTYTSSKTSRDDYDTSRSRSRLVNMNTSAYQNMIITPIKDFSDCKDIVKQLKERKSVIINVDQMDKTSAKRAVDFLSGAICAIDGDIKKISNSIVVVAPSNIKLTGMFGEDIPSNINESIF